MLKKIKLTNFKCFENLEMELGRLNLLSGINSMGKSSVVQSILLLKQAYDAGALEKGAHLNGDYVQIGTGSDLLFYNANGDISISMENDEGKSFVWTLDYLTDADYLNLNIEKSSGLENLTPENFSFLDDGFEYITAERLGPRKSYQKSYYNVNIHNNIGRQGEFAAYYLLKRGGDDITNAKITVENSSKEDRITVEEVVNEWMRKITPGISLELTDVKKTDSVCVSIRQMEEAASHGTVMTYKPVNVGFGISYVLPVIVALVKASKGDVIVLENPEAHLHPKGQRYMGELIARAAAGGAQIIVESHSDHILNGIRLAVKKKIIPKEDVGLFYFGLMYTEDDISYHGYEQPHIDEDGGLDFWPKGFFDEWKNALLDLL